MAGACLLPDLGSGAELHRTPIGAWHRPTRRVTVRLQQTLTLKLPARRWIHEICSLNFPSSSDIKAPTVTRPTTLSYRVLTGAETMSSMRSWLRSSLGGSPSSPGGSPPPEPLSVGCEIADIRDAMEAADMVVNDDIDGGEARLRDAKDPSAFHLLTLGGTLFVRYLLGAHRDVLVEAVDVFCRCEARALADMKAAQKLARREWLKRTLKRDRDSRGASIYSRGTEFAMVQLEAQLLGTVATVMQNPKSVKDAVVALYKIRKLVKTLDRIVDAEGRAMKRHLSRLAGKSLSDDEEFEVIDAAGDEEEDDMIALGNALEDDWTEVDEGDAALPTEEAIENILAKLDVGQQEVKTAPASRKIEPALDPSLLTNPIDVFIHTSANMCYGLLFLVRGAIPSTFSRLLNVLGFQDDHDRGLRMLWQASQFADVSVNGAIAGLLLLAYYNETMQAADIQPSETDVKELAAQGEMVGFPRARCRSLIATLSERFPDSGLVTLEAGRLLAFDRDLKESIKVLDMESETPWITYLILHERAMHSMFQMNWTLMRDLFLRCVPHCRKESARNHFFMACAEVELYRDCFHLARALSSDKNRSADKKEAEKEAALYEKAALYKKAAERNLQAAAESHRDFMGLRNIARWEDRAEAMGIDLIDAIGVSPAQEMIFLCHGTNRMQGGADRALGDLSWDRCTADKVHVDQIKRDPLEGAVRGLCKASLLRRFGRFREARWALQEEVLKNDRCASRVALYPERGPELTTQIRIRTPGGQGRVHPSRRALRGRRRLLGRRFRRRARLQVRRRVPPQEDARVLDPPGDSI